MKRALKALTGVLVLLIAFNGCVSKDGVLNDLLEPKTQSGSPYIPSDTAAKAPDGTFLMVRSKEEILRDIKRNYQNFGGMKANVQIAFSNNDPASQNCQGYLAYKQPGKLSVKGYKELIPNFFTLIMNYPEFWFYVPRYNTVYTGRLSYGKSSRGFQIQLDPLLVEKSFLAKPLGPGEFAEMKEVEPPFYLLSFFIEDKGRKILKRKIWVDRRDLMVTKEIYFSSQGIAETEFIRKDYKKDLFVSLPKIIEFRKLQTNEGVQIKFLRSYLNPEISENTFNYKIPDGVIIETVT